ncbi:MAG TPA: zf-HC2 domain-containing protein [Candidatus Deferrimicrobiaceae bacterium]|jgi:anti-sigma factor RsiW
MKTNGCQKYEISMARYIHGEILRQEREALEQHLEQCAACRDLYADVAEADRLMRALPASDIAPPPWLHARIMARLADFPKSSLLSRWRGWGWSLAATSAGAIAAVLIMHGTQGTVPSRTASVAPSTGAVTATPPEPAAALQVPVPVPAPSRARPEPAPPVTAPTVVAQAETQAHPPVAVAVPEPVVKIIREVHIYLYSPTAQRVAVTGDFNGWDAKGVSLKPVEGKTGMWETDLQLQPGAYAYNFIVDGDLLVPDPDSLNQAPDGFGGTNSILLVKDGARS